MSDTTCIPPIAIGDRVEIQPLRRALAAFVGQHGTVTAMFDTPHGSCTVQLDNYADQPDLFLYRIEAVQCVVPQTHYLAGSIRNQKRTTA